MQFVTSVFCHWFYPNSDQLMTHMLFLCWLPFLVFVSFFVETIAYAFSWILFFFSLFVFNNLFVHCFSMFVVIRARLNIEDL